MRHHAESIGNNLVSGLRCIIYVILCWPLTMTLFYYKYIKSLSTNGHLVDPNIKGLNRRYLPNRELRTSAGDRHRSKEYIRVEGKRTAKNRDESKRMFFFIYRNGPFYLSSNLRL